MSDDLTCSASDLALLALGRDLRDRDYAFGTVTPLTQARVNGRPANAWAADLRGVFGWSRPFRPDILPAHMLDLMREAGVLTALDGGWRSTVRLSSLGNQHFFHSAFPTVSPDAVFFGPDTVRFAGAIRQVLPKLERDPERAADIGCGAGPGGIVIAAAVPGAEVLMLDINDEALRLARVNAALNGTPNAVSRRSDILAGAAGSFDLIVSNPPYLIDPGQRAYRHGGGRWGEGLSVAILEAALARLSAGGTLVLYTGSAIVAGSDTFRGAAERSLAGSGCAWTYVEIDPDVFGEELEAGLYAEADRIAAVVLTATKEIDPWSLP